jgi:microcompartment protein CcmL/EutN
MDLASIAKGYSTLDAIVKRATVKIEMARAVSSGKFVILYSGEIAHVEESYAAALEAAGNQNIDHVAITNPHAQIFRAFKQGAQGAAQQATLIAELHTISSTLLAADAALKASDVRLGSMTLAEGIGGKGFFLLHGALCDIEAASDIVQAVVRDDRLIALEVIANPHSEIVGFF